MAERKFTLWHSMRDDIGNYSWCVHDGLVFVRTQNGQKATQVGGSPPHYIARLLAKELGASHCDDMDGTEYKTSNRKRKKL